MPTIDPSASEMQQRIDGLQRQIVELRRDMQIAHDATASTLRMIAQQEVERIAGARLLLPGDRATLDAVAADRATWKARREDLLRHLMRGAAWSMAVLMLVMWWDQLKAILTGRPPIGGGS